MEWTAEQLSKVLLDESGEVRQPRYFNIIEGGQPVMPTGGRRGDGGEAGDVEAIEDGVGGAE